MYNQIIIIILIIIIYIVYSTKQNPIIEKMSLVEAFDRKKYLVRDLNDKKESANLLAKLMTDIKKLLTMLMEDSKNTTDQELLKYKSNVETIYNKIDSVKVRENEGENDLTSYSVNKGEELVFCVRSKINNKIHDINELMYVAIHEVAHIGCPETGHTRLFAKINLFLLRKALEKGFYLYKNYASSPVEYCGMTLNSSILG
jgi:hypothetical protein